MNFFRFHIGDYAAATAHLTFVEDAAFMRLLRIYYRDEKPLPADLKAVQRLAGARSKEERDAVATVLEEFFELRDTGWHNKRCDEEIAAAQDAQGDAEERRAHERERKRRYRQRRRELFEDLRALGIVPPFDTPMDELEAMLSRGTGAGQGRGQGRGRPESGTANHPPDTIQEQVIGGLKASTEISERATLEARACLLMKQAGCFHVNPSHPELIAAIAEGVTPEALADTVREGIEAGKVRPFAWAIATARGRHAAGTTAPPPGGEHGRSGESLADQALRRLTVIEAGHA